MTTRSPDEHEPNALLPILDVQYRVLRDGRLALLIDSSCGRLALEMPPQTAETMAALLWNGAS